MKKLLWLWILALVIQGCGGENKTAHKETEHAEEGTIHLSPESQKLIDLEIVRVNKQPFQTFIESAGEIAKETENMAHITSSEPGILKNYLKEIGETVEKETPLAIVETRSGKVLQLVSSGHGVIMAEYVKPGEAVDNLTSIMTVADPDLLRASFNVYEKDIGLIQTGQKVMVLSSAYPNKEFEGQMVFISPSVDEATRTIKIRVNVKNEEHLLKFGMFVTGKIEVATGDSVLVVPHDVIQTIEGKTTAFVQDEKEPNEFQMREIKIGRQSDNRVEVLSGLKDGDQVAAKGSFYLKSELLKEELSEGHGH